MRSTVARRVFPVAVATFVLLAVLAVPPAPVAAQEAETASTTFGFALQTDGDAQVSVTTRFPLDSDADREGFDRLAEAHTAGDDSPLDAEPFERAAALSSEANGRPMSVQGVDRTASRANGTGQLSLQFTWTNFTDPGDDRLAVGDAFRTPGGTWFPELREDQELVISFPPDYSPQSISVPGTRYQLVNRTVRIQGPASFEPGTPALVLEQADNPPPPEPPWGLFTAAGVGVAVLAILAYVFRHRLRSAVGDGADEDDEDDGEATVPEPADEPGPMDEPLLSDEERVVKLLASRGGRMKQVEIVEATDWSNAKVSQLLSEMEENGRVDKLRIGRENLISLPGRGPGEG